MALSYDFVGDLAETTALLWPDGQIKANQPLQLGTVVDRLQSIKRPAAAEQMKLWLDDLPEAQRWALLKLATGGMRVGVSARMVRLSIADAYNKPVEEIEEIRPIIQHPAPLPSPAVLPVQESCR